MKKLCRWCTHYEPDERYRGVIGWCKLNDVPTEIVGTCGGFEEGKQKWMCGKDVEE